MTNSIENIITADDLNLVTEISNTFDYDNEASVEVNGEQYFPIAWDNDGSSYMYRIQGVLVLLEINVARRCTVSQGSQDMIKHFDSAW